MKTYEYLKTLINYNIIYKLLKNNINKSYKYISKLNEGELINLRWYLIDKNNNYINLDKDIVNINLEIINLINNYIFVYQRKIN